MRHVLTLLILGWLLTASALAQPRHLYLTWDNPDTAHTQTIVFQTLGKANEPRAEIKMDGATAKPTRLGVKTVMLGGTERRVHSITVTGLKPATVYSFRAGDNRYGMSAWRSFRTLPDDGRPLRVASGGDMYRHPETVELLRAAARQKPDVALIGGDIAYANDELDKIGFWDDWFDNWANNLDAKGGPMVPMICAIGNHEVGGAFDQPKKNAPFYFTFFPQGGDSYFSRRLGKDMEVVVLDSSHVAHPKEQVPFLQAALQSMQERKVRYRLALYHVPLYPTHRPYDDPYAQRGRQFWLPLFDKYGLTVGLENHDHTCKRTFSLKGGKVVQSGGTVYLGDGCWGREPRSVDSKRWYVAKASSSYHLWMLQGEAEGLRCQAIGRDGKAFDQTLLKVAAKGT